MTTLVNPAVHLRKKVALANQYLTTCSVCRFGIYHHQAWHWSRKPLGMVHTECVGGQP